MALILEPWQWTAAAVAMSTVVATLALRKSKVGGGDKPGGGGLKRRLSFTSQCMAAGSWPAGFSMAEPIINAAVSFNTCPLEADVLEFILGCMAYDRFRGVPCEDKATGAWVIKVPEEARTLAEAKRHLTIIDVKGGTQGVWGKVGWMDGRGVNGLSCCVSVGLAWGNAKISHPIWFLHPFRPKDQ